VWIVARPAVAHLGEVTVDRQHVLVDG
jgi:hypothetical protein